MNRQTNALLMCGSLFTLVAASHAGPTLPNEFNSADQAISPMFAYFGGVTAWGATASTTEIYQGNSVEVWADLVDDIFPFAGFGVGTFGINPPALNVTSAMDTFSVTIQSPASGQLSFFAVLREDDNNDGTININGGDDEWESPVIMLQPGVNVYNIPLTDFEDVNPDEGNNAQNFATVGRMSYHLVFETFDSYPGGAVTGHVSMLVDHLGLYVGAQEIPGQLTCDLVDSATFMPPGDGVTDGADLAFLLGEWGANPGSIADTVSSATLAPPPDGIVDGADLAVLLGGWGPCN